jgi:hypothetical protein
MKMLTEYLDHALTFERMASGEANPEVRSQFEKQAAAYRRLATVLAEKYGLPPPSTPENLEPGVLSGPSIAQSDEPG